MNAIKKVLDKIVEIFCITIMALMTLLVTWQVVTRYFLNNPSVVTEQFAQYLFVWLVLYGAAYVFGKRDHMAIVFVVEKMPLKVRRAVIVIQEVIIALFAAGVMVYGGNKTMQTQMMQKDAALQIPMGVVYSAITFSGICIIFYAIYNIVSTLKQTVENTK